MDYKILVVGMAALMLTTFSAYAVGPAAIEWVSESNYAEDTAAFATDTTEGGNITRLNITAVNSSTEHWAGYLGLLSSTGMMIVLQDASENVFYNWSWNTANEGEVCAGIATSYVWNDLEAGAAADLDTAWAFGGISDTAVNTFTSTGDINLTGVEISGAPAAGTGEDVADTFKTILVRDATGSTTDSDFLFCADTQIGTGTGYDGSPADYEVIVPVSYGATETYYFYVELN